MKRASKSTSRLMPGCSSSAVNSEPKTNSPFTCARSEQAFCRRDRAPGKAPWCARPRSRTQTCRADILDSRFRTGRKREQSLRCRCRCRTCARVFQLRAQFAIVVNLAVENDPGGAILIVNRFAGLREVNDREPAHRQPLRRRRSKNHRRPAAVPDRRVHARDQLTIDRSAGKRMYACYATHFVFLNNEGAPRRIKFCASTLPQHDFPLEQALILADARTHVQRIRTRHS